MNGILGIVLGTDGTIRDIGILAGTPEERKIAHEILFVLQDEIDRFEATAKERIRSMFQVRSRPSI